jgi:magnesium transporter
MLTIYRPERGSLVAASPRPGEGLPTDAVWIDMIRPDVDEDRQVEALVGIAVPTREEMLEIEVSSRLYVENGAIYMTATLMCASDTPIPLHTPVTFILAQGRLITVRYDDPRPFALTAAKLNRACPEQLNGEGIFLDLLDAIIDRAADILEKAGAEVEEVSHDIFEPHGKDRVGPIPYKAILKSIGRKGELVSKVRESLVSIGRLLLFASNESDQTRPDGSRWSKERRALLKTMQRDVQSLSDHASYLSGKITFLLDAMLGMVSLQQNDIIKLFSVAAVVLMPPTLVASIYGMNFAHMPELQFTYGYPMALLLMLVAAIVPYLFFKWKKWL